MDEPGERAREEVWAMVALIVGLGLLGLLIGRLLDTLFGTAPGLLFICSIVGLGVGLFLALRSALSFARQNARR